MRRVRAGSIATTPARLRLASVLLVGGIVALWAASALALEARHDAATEIASESALLLIDAEELYVNLADADATASRAFLDLESDDVRRRYEENLSAAAGQLGVIGDEVGGDSGTQQAVAVVSDGLPEYASSVATARVNNRLGNPVGAAYLRQASGQMRNGILPETTRIFRDASERMASDYRSGTSSPQVVVMAVVAGLVLIGLVTTQIYLFRRTHRILNVGLVVATVLVIAAVAASLVWFDRSQDDLVRAQREGSDHVHVLGAARILGLRAQSASTLAVIDRQSTDEALTLAGELGGDSGRGGLLSKAAVLLERTGSEATMRDIRASFARFRGALTDVQGALEGRDFPRAERLALGRQSERAVQLDEQLGDEVDIAKARLADATAAARAGYAVVAVAMSLAALLAISLVLFGIRPRIAEYR
jgi:hypothetical protein